ncbi:beta-galactosidase [Paraburkholderia sp. JHI869]|uniref:beta-galactosidase n=1 Tax=Paraburkholderia sp. JHI869 TaxID=3112959 RepID=UPI00316DD5FD
MEKQNGSLWTRRPIAIGVWVLASAFAGGSMTAKAEDLAVDGSASPAAPETGWLRMGTSKAPDGQTLTINNQYLVKDGKPWLPVMGEIHFSRVPPDQWDTELAKMKASGINVVATYVIWNHQEPQNGQFEWTGGKDLKKFVELCAKHGMYAFVRVGPWTHGEVRYGGSPEWIVNQMPTRSNDAVYIGYVKRYYNQIGKQLQGQLWKDGGPVIGIQLENEYNLTGPLQGADHISELKKLALAAGLDVPLYTVTGWDNTVFPHHEVTPVFGGYPDEPWGIDDKVHPPAETYVFRFTSRVGGNLGAQTENKYSGDADKVVAHTPFFGAEFAGGLPEMYRRRPVVAPDDIGSMLPVQLGSGVNLYGYYMYHGGHNPPGQLHLQESTASGGYNDLPTINYDFQAPFGANGEPHAVLGKIRPVHAFLDQWGQDLAPMKVDAPDVRPQSVTDLKSPRYSLRSNGRSAFLFVNNYVRQFEMAPQKDVRFAVKLANETVMVPSQPITIPTGAYFIWPVEMNLHGVALRYATAQPVTKVDTGDGPVFVFHEIKAIPAEFSFAPGTTVADAGDNVNASDVSDPARVVLHPGALIQVKSNTGAAVRILMLSEEQAEKLTVVNVGGHRQLVLADGQPFVRAGKLVLRTTSPSGFHFGVFPAPTHQVTASAAVEKTAAGPDDNPRFQWYSSAVPHPDLHVNVEQVRQAGAVPPVATGGPANAAIEPYPETFGKAAAWKIELPKNALAGLSNAYLSISYVGDVGRLFAGTSFIDDDFYDGLPWNVGLKQLPSAMSAPLTLTVLPLRDDAKVYIDEKYRPKTSDGGQTAVLKDVKLIPEFELTTSGY